MEIDGHERTVLLDSGCSTCVIYAPMCKFWVRKAVSVVTLGGESQSCVGVGSVVVSLPGCRGVKVRMLVVDFKPLGFDCILGMNGICAMGGVSINESGSVSFGRTQNVCAAGLCEEREDFTVVFDDVSRSWTVTWNWSGGREPERLRNQIPEYDIPAHAREHYEAELERWIGEGWLQDYDEKRLGPPRGLIPLLAVVQVNKGKVRPVLDFRELNSYVEAFTADADVCADRLRDWRRKGAATAMLDLQTAYMQIKVEESLWPFQTVSFRGRRYCLTRLGFGLNIAPQVMKTVISKVLALDDKVLSAASAFVDDIYVDESVLSASVVREHLLNYGLACKEAVSVSRGARVLGLDVRGDSQGLVWKRYNEAPSPPPVMTRRSVFSWCGKMTSHLPVCGWLRPAVAFIKRKVSHLSTSWDDEVNDKGLRAAVNEVAMRVAKSDPAKGRWDVDGTEACVWVDASSLATGVCVEVGGSVLEDASWLRPDDGAGHINMAELDAVIKGMNLGLAWKMNVLHLRTDSQTVFHWVTDALSGRSRLKTKASGEMLIRRRLGIITALVEEYNLKVDVSLIPSAHNLADPLTRVPQAWIKSCPSFGELEASCGAMSFSPSNKASVERIHEITGHQGVDRSLYFAQRASLPVSRAEVRDVVGKCSRCLSIDPAPVKTEKGSLSVRGTWERVGMDITHHLGVHFMSLVDHGPSRFSIWKRLTNQNSDCVVRALESVFLERGAPAEVLTDNDPAFRSDVFSEFARKWAVHVHYRCAHAPSGNGITERCHRTVKRIAARKNCSIEEAVYWYNITPKDGVLSASAPANEIYSYEMRVLGVDRERIIANGPSAKTRHFKGGDLVWVRPPGNRCSTQFSQGRVTGIVSDHSIEVNGIPRHVRDLRAASQDSNTAVTEMEEGLDDGAPSEGDVGDAEPRRSGRATRPPDRYEVSVGEDAF